MTKSFDIYSTNFSSRSLKTTKFFKKKLIKINPSHIKLYFQSKIKKASNESNKAFHFWTRLLLVLSDGKNSKIPQILFGIPQK